MTRACSLIDTFRAARTKALLGLGALSLTLAVTGCSGDCDDDPEPVEERFSFCVTSMAGLLELAPDAQGHTAGGCGRSVKVQQAGAPMPGDLTVGAGGGYGGLYCFASTS